MRKDRSCSAGLLEFPAPSGSPDTSRRNKEKTTGLTNPTRLRNTPHAPLVDLTIFHIPGMDVKLQYQSKVISEDVLLNQVQTSSPDAPRSFLDEESRIEKAFRPENVSDNELKPSSSLHGITNPNYSPTSSKTSLDNFPFNMSITPPPDTQKSFSFKKPGIKKASLFAWMTLQSVPEETIISPHILEFLEQALEPIPPKTNFNSTANSSLINSDQDITNYGNYVYASFPVDVIVYFHMQPSTFRFSCLPVSRVECMLQLPSLDIVFSSKRAEDELLLR